MSSQNGERPQAEIPAPDSGGMEQGHWNHGEGSSEPQLLPRSGQQKETEHTEPPKSSIFRGCERIQGDIICSVLMYFLTHLLWVTTRNKTLVYMLCFHLVQSNHLILGPVLHQLWGWVHLNKPRQFHEFLPKSTKHTPKCSISWRSGQLIWKLQVAFAG